MPPSSINDNCFSDKALPTPYETSEMRPVKTCLDFYNLTQPASPSDPSAQPHHDVSPSTYPHPNTSYIPREPLVRASASDGSENSRILSSPLLLGAIIGGGVLLIMLIVLVYWLATRDPKAKIRRGTLSRRGMPRSSRLNRAATRVRDDELRLISSRPSIDKSSAAEQPPHDRERSASIRSVGSSSTVSSVDSEGPTGHSLNGRTGPLGRTYGAPSPSLQARGTTRGTAAEPPSLPPPVSRDEKPSALFAGLENVTPSWERGASASDARGGGNLFSGLGGGSSAGPERVEAAAAAAAVGTAEKRKKKKDATRKSKEIDAVETSTVAVSIGTFGSRGDIATAAENDISKWNSGKVKSELEARGVPMKLTRLLEEKQVDGARLVSLTENEQGSLLQAAMSKDAELLGIAADSSKDVDGQFSPPPAYS
ncbi:hypothetical protein HDU96_010970 [Phlyctochytrium bullatum]|nr:hypothetical protein HDU96_010970 [Phlyctochytrium bullatum]